MFEEDTKFEIQMRTTAELVRARHCKDIPGQQIWSYYGNLGAYSDRSNGCYL
jgi:hypothetical protein